MTLSIGDEKEILNFISGMYEILDERPE